MNSPIPISQMLTANQSNFEESEEFTDNILSTKDIQTREQIRTLLETAASIGELSRILDRPKDEDKSPSAILQPEIVREGATGVLLHITNRLNTIITDDTRWKISPQRKESAEEKAIRLRREKLELDERELALKMRQESGQLELDVQKAKVQQFKEQLWKGEDSSTQALE